MWYEKTAPPATKSEDPPPVQPRPFRGDDGAADLVRALKARDWLGARPYLADPPNAEGGAFRLVCAGGVEGLEQWIDEAVRSTPGDPLPLLVKGIRYVNWAWSARGSAFADQVDSSVWPIWFERLSVAEDALQSVVQAQPGTAEAWHWLIVLGRARQVSKEELWRRYHGLVAADPTNYYGHVQMLEGLMRKWSGSDAEMFDFARTVAAANPATHLPVLVAMAHLQKSYDADSRVDYMKTPEVAKEVLDAAYASIFHDDYEYTFFTADALNWFAQALVLTGYMNVAQACFDAIGDDYVTNWPWAEGKISPGHTFAVYRDICAKTLAEAKQRKGPAAPLGPSATP